MTTKTTKTRAKKLPLVAPRKIVRVRTGPWDRIFGGGLVPGSLTVLGGRPGVGKSTLALQACKRACKGKKRGALFITSEQTAAQLKESGKRLDLTDVPIEVLSTKKTLNRFGRLEAIVEKSKPRVIVLDSVKGLCGKSWNIAADLFEVLKIVATKADAVVLVTVHTKKNGDIDIPTKLRHMVDSIAKMEMVNAETSFVRSMHTEKSRYSYLGKMVHLEMTESGFILTRKH